MDSPLWCSSLRSLPLATRASYSCIGPWLSRFTVRRQQLVPSPRAGAPRGWHSPFSIVESATADALLIPDIRSALCTDVLLHRTWRSVGVRGFVRPGRVHNRRRESRGTRTRGRATAWSRAKGARMFRGVARSAVLRCAFRLCDFGASRKGPDRGNNAGSCLGIGVDVAKG